MSGLTDEQLGELVARAEDFLEEPWDKEDYAKPRHLATEVQVSDLQGRGFA